MFIIVVVTSVPQAPSLKNTTSRAIVGYSPEDGMEFDMILLLWNITVTPRETINTLLKADTIGLLSVCTSNLWASSLTLKMSSISHYKCLYLGY